MKILEVSTSGTIGSEQMGPISTIVYDLSRCFAELGHSVTVVDPKPPKHTNGSRKKLPPTINLIELDYPSADDLRHRRKTSYVKGWVDIYRYLGIVTSSISLDDFDVIHTHSPQAAYVIQTFHKKACVLTLHTPNWCIDEDLSIKKKLRNWISIQSNINIVTRASAIRNSMLTVGLGDYVKKKVTNASLAIIPSGLDTDRWVPEDRETARNHLGISDEDFVLIFVGRVKPIKGIEILLDALQQLKPISQNIKLLIIGNMASGSIDGKVTAFAKTLLERSAGLPVQFLGYINNQSDEFKRYISTADVAVVPSLQEPQGLVVLEHLSMGIPVIASEVGGIPSMVTSEVGVLVPPGDSSELALAIRNVYEDREKLASMQHHARNHVVNNHEWSKVAARYIAEINKHM